MKASLKTGKAGQPIDRAGLEELIMHEGEFADYLLVNFELLSHIAGKQLAPRAA